MNHLNLSIGAWQTILIVLLVVPVLVLNAHLFELPQHHLNLNFAKQLPQDISFHQQHTNNAKNLETLNSKIILSSNEDSNHNVMVNAEKPVHSMYIMQRIEQLQQKAANYIDLDLVAKNKNAFFDEDSNKMRLHGQQGNVLSAQFIDGNKALMKKYPTVKTITGYNRKVKSTSFAEQLLNNLAANNVAVNFSQTMSSNILPQFNPQGTHYSVDGETGEAIVRNTFPQPSQVIIMNGPTRIYGAGTESKFPPFLELFVQRIQKYFSVYKYEDLSRPALPSEMTVDSVIHENAMSHSGNVVGITSTTPEVTKINSF